MYLVVFQPLRLICRMETMLTAKFAEITVDVSAFFAISTRAHEVVWTQFWYGLCDLEALTSIGVNSFGVRFERLLFVTWPSFFFLLWRNTYSRGTQLKSLLKRSLTSLTYSNLQWLESRTRWVQLEAWQMTGWIREHLPNLQMQNKSYENSKTVVMSELTEGGDTGRTMRFIIFV